MRSLATISITGHFLPLSVGISGEIESPSSLSLLPFPPSPLMRLRLTDTCLRRRHRHGRVNQHRMGPPFHCHQAQAQSRSEWPFSIYTREGGREGDHNGMQQTGEGGVGCGMYREAMPVIRQYSVVFGNFQLPIELQSGMASNLIQLQLQIKRDLAGIIL